MKAIICLDENGGCLFNNRRVSRDRAVTGDILSSNDCIYMSPYSGRMFRDDKCICPEAFPDLEGLEQKTCFFEDPDHLMRVIDKVDTLAVYGWNRIYPSDKKFKVPEAFEKTEETELAGYSHEKITRVLYRRGEVK